MLTTLVNLMIMVMSIVTWYMMCPVSTRVPGVKVQV